MLRRLNQFKNCTGGIVAVAITLLVTLACGSTSVKNAKTYKLNETFVVGYMEYTVYGFRYDTKLSSNPMLNQPPNAIYLIVDLTVGNVDKEQRAIPSFKLVDETGAEYGTSDRAWAAEGSVGLLENLNPSVSKRANVIFDVPQGRTYKLKVSGGFASTENALVDLSQPTNTGDKDAPSNVVVEALVKETINKFGAGVDSGNFTSLRDSASDTFQNKYSADQVAEGFQSYTAKKKIVVPILKKAVIKDAEFDRPPTVRQEKGLDILVASGKFATKPYGVRFDFEYVMLGGEWKLLKLVINIP